ncbi:GDP-mannose 4,6-dehydratase [Vulcanococcus sp. Clear-D1]|uniref:GDP-mannose 4,6-dehydratase n=1 Tax=Vulcanococcus sp. Clear-D1 TaxID=2766970 RepID=UPI0019CAD4BA|nr:GDP-mannose 4,6-dehydratase [Vulcanococcus sp. Clear-D1]MBD1193164.1 GDP-mannose 4,6-dehydratase [Vulcanococcus sp. Clear-D1]
MNVSPAAALPPRRALIIGITGQDGAYLAAHLLAHGYQVFGSSRDARPSSLSGLQMLGIAGRLHVVQMAPADFRSVIQTISNIEPDEIYNLSGQSSVAVSFSQPIETLESVIVATGNLLEAIRFLGLEKKTRFYNACSSECFGDTDGAPASEHTPFHPHSPYAVAKAGAYWLVANYRSAYGLFACSGILFNHESPLRPDRFVTRKIVAAAVRIAGGSDERLKLGNIDIKRDWGWAPEYVDAMHRMLQVERPMDFVVATGRTVGLSYFVENCFSQLGLDWRRHVDTDPALLRPSDMKISRADPARAERELGWRATVGVEDVIARLIAHERQSAAGRTGERSAH